MSDLEQECEDALFAVCDARERFPFKCADELQKCIKLRNDINMLKVAMKPTPPFNVPRLTDEQAALLGEDMDEKNDFEFLDRRLRNSVNKLDNLKLTIKQINREKVCEMNKLLKD